MLYKNPALFIKSSLSYLGFVFRLIHVIFLFFSLFGCIEKRSENELLRINIATDPPSLDPRVAPDITSINLILALFEGLTRLDKTGKPVEALSEKIEVSEDLKTYKFTLRNALWSDGTPITSRDVKETWESILSPKFPAPYAYKLYPIVNAQQIKMGRALSKDLGVEIPDPKTLIVHLNKPTPQFLELIASAPFTPLPSRLIQKENPLEETPDKLVTSGPFLLDSWQHEDHIILKKNPLYWDQKNVHLETITCYMVDDPSTELYMYEMDELDWIGAPFSAISSDHLPKLLEKGLVNTTTTNAIEYLALNCQTPPLNNRNIRRALALAVNRQEIIDHILQNNQEMALALCPDFPKRKALKLFQDNAVAEARNAFKLGLKELGLSKKEFPVLSYAFNTSATHKKIAEVLQQQWKENLGIQISLKNTEWKSYIPLLVSGNYEIGRMGWVGEYRDPEAFLAPFTEEESGANLIRWHSPLFISLMKYALQQPLLEKRMQSLTEAETLLIEQMPLIPLFYGQGSYMKKSKVKEAFVTPLLTLDFKWIKIEKI